MGKDARGPQRDGERIIEIQETVCLGIVQHQGETNEQEKYALRQEPCMFEA